MPSVHEGDLTPSQQLGIVPSVRISSTVLRVVVWQPIPSLRAHESARPSLRRCRPDALPLRPFATGTLFTKRVRQRYTWCRVNLRYALGAVILTRKATLTRFPII